MDRKTIRRYAKQLGANSPMATGAAEPAGKNSSVATGLGAREQIPRPPAPAADSTKAVRSAWKSHRAWIEEQAGLGRNAVAIYPELVEQHDFSHRYTLGTGSDVANGFSEFPLFWRNRDSCEERSPLVAPRDGIWAVSW